ncbi:hypothetical protein GQ53DRAFT_147907 [Thozetella sp. PMI_491]|nr:hypothetical protein GQ53DRAFT_147907 [Thozetella sp. PMI_491]
MAKRSWTELNGGADRQDLLQAASDESIPHLSRKIKACVSCRKHKIKCLIDDSGPPCRRCVKHGLECVIGRNLQAIIDEKTQYTEAIFRDLENIHATVRELARKQGIPEPGVLHTRAIRHATSSGVPQEGAVLDPQLDNTAESSRANGAARHEDDEVSRDASPEVSPEDDPSMPRVPIQSLYALTKLTALRSPHDTGPVRQQAEVADDFIARGVILREDAERLFAMYRDRLDAFMYCVGCPYRSLDETRSKSRVLTAAILTVAALHDARADPIYGLCSSEFRQLIERSIFSRNVNRDYLRAMCVASYWLSDMSWMLSGYAIRRAFEYELHNQLQRAIQEPQNTEATDGTRLWFILHICDRRLATLYGRPAIVHEYPSLDEIESYLETPASNAQDRRLMSQVALSTIFKGIRDLFGPDRGKPIPRAHLDHIAQFNKQLGRWYEHWSCVVAEEYDHIGRFPRKAARLHFNFAKLHLYSHVFRGLSGHDPIPHYFLDCTAAAISAATSTIDLILTDPEVSAVVVGMPSYLHCMTAFACMFLIKASAKYGKNLINPDHVWRMTTRLVRQFRSVPAGKWHLTRLMTHRLERMASILTPIRSSEDLPGSNLNPDDPYIPEPSVNAQHFEFEGIGAGDSPSADFQPDQFFNYNMNFGLPETIPFSSMVFGTEDLQF